MENGKLSVCVLFSFVFIYLLYVISVCSRDSYFLIFKINVVCMHSINGVRNSMEPPLSLLDAIPFNNISTHLKCNINPEIFLVIDG